MTIRTRFAPSPTGYLHVGGARTALYSWLYARKHGGVFILRIEDTDLARSTAESVNAILEGMTWLGLEYDEGPFYQTQRAEHYRAALNKLLKEGKAYHCYCSRERLEALRAGQMARKEKPRYDRHCRDLKTPAPDVAVAPGILPPATLAEPFAGALPCTSPVVRFKNPLDGEVVVHDEIKGTVVFQNSELDDLIIARSDGSPTYNFTVAVDDWDMRVTHVIRGDDHLNNTPRQINILKALGATPPSYSHVPMILGNDGRRLSKRHGAVSVMQFREDGFLPEALLNHLVRLGWAHGDQEIFSLDEMIKLFDIKDVHRAASAFNTEKLLWLNQHYIKTSDPAHIAHHLSWHMGRLGIDPTLGPDLVEVVKALRERAKTLVEMAEASAIFYKDFAHYEESAVKHLSAQVATPFLALREGLVGLAAWEPPAIHQLISDTAAAHGLTLGKLAQPLRVAVTGKAASPPIDITVHLLGLEKTRQRITRALEYIEKTVS